MGLPPTLLLLLSFITLASTLPDPIYTLHYVKSYRRDVVDNNFGCGKSMVYGTYIHPLGAVDGLYTLMNSHIYGFNGVCQRKDTYIKIFGEAQDFSQLTTQTNVIVDQINGAINRIPTKKLIIDWKYLPEESKREDARRALQEIATGLQTKGFTVFIKAPASYFCLNVGGKKYILDLPINNFIVQLYGEEPGKYITYESIFGDSKQGEAEAGYSKDCPKYPTQSNLKAAGQDKRVYFQKTLDSSLSGFIPTSAWQKFLQTAGESKYNSLYFYDGYPLQTVDL